MIPAKIQVMAETYTVRLVKGLKSDGECCVYDKTIEIRKSLEDYPNELWRVLFHELGHAFAYESGLSEILNAQSEEQFSWALSGFLKQLAPALVDFPCSPPQESKAVDPA